MSIYQKAQVRDMQRLLKLRRRQMEMSHPKALPRHQMDYPQQLGKDNPAETGPPAAK